jgi:hypothetical protein
MSATDSQLRAVVEAIDARDPESDSLYRYTREQLVQMAARALKATMDTRSPNDEHDRRRRRDAGDEHRRR